ncbi:MAG: hypothetical protein CMG98_05400 [Marinovum sp.]|nr:hypothetical protein [Marinovum sp.]
MRSFTSGAVCGGGLITRLKRWVLAAQEQRMQPCSQFEQLYLSGAGPPDQLFSRLISVTGYKSPSVSRCNSLRIKHEPKALQASACW